MKNFMYLTGLFLLITAQTATAQGIAPEIDWEAHYDVPTGGVGFMDYTDDFIIGLSSVPGGSSANFFDDAGVEILMPELYGVEWVEPVSVNTQSLSHTYFVSLQATSNMLTYSALENATHLFDGDSLWLPATNSWLETIEFAVIPGETVDQLYITGMAFNHVLNKNVCVVKRLDYDKSIQSFAEYEEIAFIFSSKNTYPTDMLISPSGHIFIWGYYDKNPAGTTHDLFLTKMSTGGDIIFSKSFASYSGQDDIASHLVIDNSGYVYGLSQSTDNVAPFSQHIAAFRINPNNGKSVWVKRFGVGSEGSEVAYCADGNNAGTGLAFGGNVSDGAGGRNAKVWRLDQNGNAIWNKTISFGPTGTTEACRGVAFSPYSGDVYITGISGPHYFIACMASTVNTYIWAPETRNITGDAIDAPMQIGFNDSAVFTIGGNCDNGGSTEGAILHYNEIPEKIGATEPSAIKLFPNPTSDIVHIQTNEKVGTVFVFDVYGNCVQTVQINAEVTQINLHDVPSGTYYFKIETNGTLEQLKCVKL